MLCLTVYVFRLYLFLSPVGMKISESLGIAPAISQLDHLILPFFFSIALPISDISTSSLGLRAGDIQDMRLEDIDWRSGHLTVKGKTRRPDRLPLPQDVGDAILAYLAAARPKAVEEHLFLRAQAPFRPFRSSAEIAGIVARTRDRGGIDGVPTGSHIFRHSLATNLLRAGAGLESVGTILRHSSPETTAIYAKVDLPMLMKIAQPWPGEQSC